MSVVAQFLFFPGMLFTAGAGLLTSWFDRKLTARVQMRKGHRCYSRFMMLPS